MSFTYSRTSAQIISRALRVLGVIQLGETPSTDQYNNGLEVLNTVLKELSLDGVNLEKQTTIQVPISGSQSEVLGSDGNSYSSIKTHTSATATNKPVTGTEWALYWVKGGNATAAWANATNYTSLNYVSLADTLGYDSIDRAIWRKNGVDYPVTLIKYSEYFDISDKNLESEIVTHCGIEYGPSSINLYLYPRPENLDSAALNVIVTSLYSDLTATSDVPGIGADWLNALTYVLANYLCDEYSKPLDERNYLYSKSQSLLKKCIDSQIPMETSRFVTGAY